MKLKTFMREMKAAVDAAKSVSIERAAGMDAMLKNFEELFKVVQVVKRPPKKGASQEEAAE